MTAETLRRSLQFFHCTECSCKAEEALSKSENTVGYSGIEFAGGYARLRCISMFAVVESIFGFAIQIILCVNLTIILAVRLNAEDEYDSEQDWGYRALLQINGIQNEDVLRRVLSEFNRVRRQCRIPPVWLK